jgi:hypothetical protein
MLIGGGLIIAAAAIPNIAELKKPRA